MDVFGGLSDDVFSDEALGIVEPASAELITEPTHAEPTDPATAEDNKGDAGTPDSVLPADAGVSNPETAPADWKQQLEQAQREAREHHATFTRDRQEKLQMQAQLAAAQAELQRLRDGVTAAAPGNKEDALKNFLENPDTFVNQAVSPLVNERVNAILKPLQEAAEKENARRVFNESMAEVTKNYPRLQADKEAMGRVMEAAVKMGQSMGDGTLWGKNPAILQLAALQVMGMPKEVNQAAITAAEARGREKALAELAARDAAKAGKTVNNTTNNLDASEPMSEEDRIREEIAAVSFGFGW